MFPLPVILALENTQVYIYTLYSSNVASYIETTVDKSLYGHTTLGIPDINPDNGHV